MKDQIPGRYVHSRAVCQVKDTAGCCDDGHLAGGSTTSTGAQLSKSYVAGGRFVTDVAVSGPG